MHSYDSLSFSLLNNTAASVSHVLNDLLMAVLSIRNSVSQLWALQYVSDRSQLDSAAMRSASCGVENGILQSICEIQERVSEMRIYMCVVWRKHHFQLELEMMYGEHQHATSTYTPIQVSWPTSRCKVHNSIAVYAAVVSFLTILCTTEAL